MGDLIIRRRAEMQGETWLPVANDVFRLSNSYENYSNGELNFTRGSTSWANFAMYNSLTHTFAQLEGKRIRVEFDYTITGSVGSNRGIVFAISEWPGQSFPNANDRKSFVSLPDAKSSSGHFSWSSVLSVSTFTGNVNLHDPSNYMGGMIYLMAGTSVKATLTNIKYEYLQ